MGIWREKAKQLSEFKVENLKFHTLEYGRSCRPADENFFHPTSC